MSAGGACDGCGCEGALRGMDRERYCARRCFGRRLRKLARRADILCGCGELLTRDGELRRLEDCCEREGAPGVIGVKRGV